MKNEKIPELTDFVKGYLWKPYKVQPYQEKLLQSIKKGEAIVQIRGKPVLHSVKELVELRKRSLDLFEVNICDKTFLCKDFELKIEPDKE